MMRFFVIFWLVLYYALAANGQPTNPSPGRIFTENEIPQIHILIDQDSLEQLYLEENWYSNHEYPVTFVWQDSFGADTLMDVGFRFRGNTSRDKAKKSFKISINAFEPGRRYYGLKKLNLNAETNDPSMLRSFATWRMFRDNGVPASRSNHVEVYINGAYYGLYQNCEHINDDWVNLRFGDDNGNLYKCHYPANLQYLGDDPDAYKLTPDWGGSRVYDLKTNEAADNYTNLASFITFLAQSDAVAFACDFQEHFNVYRYLKSMAIDVLTGNWDAYLFNQNNFYLYYHPRRARFEYLPYDLDNTWGIDWLGQDWAMRDIYNYAPSWLDLPLYERIMAVPAYRQAFSWYLAELCQHYFNSDWQQALLLNRQMVITPSAVSDPFRPLDFGFTENDFLNALTQASGGHVGYGIFQYGDLRRSSALDQLNEVAIAPIIWEVEENFGDFPAAIAYKLRIDGPVCQDVFLDYRFDNGAWLNLSVNAPGDEAVFSLPLLEGSHTLEFNFRVVGIDGLEREVYCSPRSFIYGSSQPKLMINEVMASNSSTVADGEGQYDDWLEVFNNGQSAASLGDYYLSDKQNAARYWSFPQQDLQAGGFALVWADGDIEQGPLHTNFSLSASGERLYLFRAFHGGLELVDYLDMPPATPDVSWGRASDGAWTWTSFQTPTPGSSNGGLRNSASLEASSDRPYPNPSMRYWNWETEGPYELWMTDGRVLQRGVGSFIDASALAPGVYLLKRGERVDRLVRQ